MGRFDFVLCQAVSPTFVWNFNYLGCSEVPKSFVSERVSESEVTWSFILVTTEIQQDQNESCINCDIPISLHVCFISIFVFSLLVCSLEVKIKILFSIFQAAWWQSLTILFCQPTPMGSLPLPSQQPALHFSPSWLEFLCQLTGRKL